MSREIWHPLPGFQGYSVSSRGWVTDPSGELVQPWDKGKGILWIAIKSEETSYRGPVWKLIMYAFFEGDYRDVTVDYKDGDSYNLALENLLFSVYIRNVKAECWLKPVAAGNNYWRFDRRRYEKK